MDLEEGREERRLTASELRCKSRGHMQDSVRGIDPLSVIQNETEMISQAKKLTRKATPELLLLIKNSLLLGVDFVHAFLEVEAALPKLLRLFYAPGEDPKLQMLASHCLVNLSLGSEEDCLKMAKAAGPFLVMQIESPNQLYSSILVDSAQALGNFSSHPNVVALLKEQGAYPRVMKLMMSDSEPVSSAAIYCLTQAFHHCQQLFSTEDCVLVVENCLKMKQENVKVLFLISLLSTNPAVIEVLKTNAFLTKSLLMLGQQLQTVPTRSWTEELTRIVSLVRILANVVSEPTGDVAVAILSLPHIFEILARLPSAGCDIPYLEKESLWLLANFLNHPNQEVRNLSRKMNLASLIFRHRGGSLAPYFANSAAS